MPLYDLVCKDGHKHLDQWLRVGERPPCYICGAETETLWTQPANVIADDIPGGILIHHGLCDESTGAPKRYYSKSEMTKEAKRRGLVNLVAHVTPQDTDKSKHTVRWT